MRIGVVLDGTTQPAWVRRLLEHIRAEHELARVAFVNAEPPSVPAAARLLGRAEEVDVADLLEQTGDEPEITIAVAGDAFDGEVWTIERDGLREFVARPPVLRASLLSAGKVLARTTAMPDPVSYPRAMHRLGLRIAAMIEHELARRARHADAPPLDPGVGNGARRAHMRIGNGRILAAAASSAVARARQIYRDRYVDLQWSVAFSFDGTLDFARFHRVEPPRDRLWADPFVVAERDRAWIFIEEMRFAEPRGFISVIEARRDGTWSVPRPVLQRPYHLSYPCVVRWNGTYYMLPETQENRTIELYRCVSFPDRWELDSVLMRNLNAVDATLFEVAGRWWLYFATDSGDAAGFDRLWLYHAPEPRGPWTAHAWNPLECDVAGGRPAGRPFPRDGRLLRAAQIGAPWYGHSIRVRELVTLTPDAWLERDLATIPPTWQRGIIGTHTLNVDGDVVVIDAVREVRRRRGVRLGAG